MKQDKRKTWQYNGCTVVPVDCQHPTWGQCGTPRNFGDGVYRNRYWRIDFPDNTHVFVRDKKDAHKYIDSSPPQRFIDRTQPPPPGHGVTVGRVGVPGLDMYVVMSEGGDVLDVIPKTFQDAVTAAWRRVKQGVAQPG